MISGQCVVNRNDNCFLHCGVICPWLNFGPGPFLLNLMGKIHETAQIGMSYQDNLP